MSRSGLPAGAGEGDPFALLGLPRRFGVSHDAVRASQRRALAELHPDRAPDPVARSRATRESAAISAAARMLLDPIRRAEMLLGPAGVDAAPPPSPELLMSSLERREELERARAADDREAMAELRRPVEARIDEILRELVEAIDGEMDGEHRDSPQSRPPKSESFPMFPDPARAGALLTELRLLRRLLESRDEEPA